MIDNIENFEYVNMGKVSIIVPIYNTAKYLTRCIESILCQTYKNYEIILINDGSEDDSFYICNEYEKKYPDIVKCAHIKHSGQGIARNKGLSLSTGNYILFVDSDDSIHKNMLKEMIECMIINQAQISICNVKLFLDDKNYVIQKSLNWGEENKKNYLEYGIHLCSLCNKIFRREVLENVNFSAIKYEDMEIVPVIISEVDNISFVNKHFYEYRLRPDSTTGCNSKFPLKDYIQAVTNSINNVNKKYYTEFVCWQARSFIDLVSKISKSDRELLLNWIKNNNSIFNISEINQNTYLKKILKSDFGKYFESKAYKKLLTIVIEDGKNIVNDNKDIQIIAKTELSIDEIEGKYTIFLNEYDSNIIERLMAACSYVDLSKQIEDYFAILKFGNEKQRYLNLWKQHLKIELRNYIFVYTSDFLIKNFHALKKNEITRNYRAVMLSKSNDIYVSESLELEESNENNAFEDILEICEKLPKESIEICMGIPTYIQNWLGRYVKYLVEKYDDEKDFELTEKIRYKEIIRETLTEIDDTVIVSLPKLTPEHKLFFMNYKYGKEAECKIVKSKCEFWHNDRRIYCQNNTYTMLEFVEYDGEKLTIEGRTIAINSKCNEEIKIYAAVNDKYYWAEILSRECSRFWLDELLYKGTEFKFEIPIESFVGIYDISFGYYYRGIKVSRNDIRFGKYFPITKKIGSSYYKIKDRALYFVNGKIEFRLCGKKGWLKHEKDFLQEIKEKYPDKYQEVKKLRIMYYIYKFFIQTHIWLVSDKANRGDDNGEAFFKYLNQTKKGKKIKSYFIYEKSNSDFKEINKIGKTVEFNSFKHKLLSLICEYQFGAYAHLSIVCPLYLDRDFYKDILCQQKFVFLQHGVAQNDYSSALNKYVQNFKAIMTSAKIERDGFVEYDYFYKPEQIKLLGLPRYDLLKSESEKIITFAPTWRRALFGDWIQSEERYVLNEGFRESKYYKFYNNILTSDKLLRCVKENGYTIHFIPHPVFFSYLDEFKFGENVIMHGKEVSYNEMFKKSSLFITDYSSAVFDFAYMKKPIIYTQFDKKEFYESQYDRGNFIYEKDGFGDVMETEEDVVNEIIRFIENDCQMSDKYKKRVDSFFEFHDNLNSERIFNEFYNK